MTLNEQMFLKIEMETWKLFTPQESISPPPPHPTEPPLQNSTIVTTTIILAILKLY